MAVLLCRTVQMHALLWNYYGNKKNMNNYSNTASGIHLGLFVSCLSDILVDIVSQEI